MNLGAVRDSCALKPSGSRTLLAVILTRGLVLSSAGEDWRHIEGKLPFDESFLHQKPIKRRDSLDRVGGKIGMPLQFGWGAARLSELAAGIEYTQLSQGMFCANGGHPFMFEGTEYPEGCEKRCTEVASCTHFTFFLSTGWCQITSRCLEEVPAEDSSATTFAKILQESTCSDHSPKAECFGGWAAELGKPIRPRGMQNL
ncbi:unnamed protein product [Polarella glacialis]|uniref:Apple domain-containing protein n=1 Tax=Polarella glacialis TaxID=89957 RepID=A0A813HNN7_POLGL|nr:unnamed protein product [Polarella glacialis]